MILTGAAQMSQPRDRRMVEPNPNITRRTRFAGKSKRAAKNWTGARMFPRRAGRESRTPAPRMERRGGHQRTRLGGDKSAPPGTRRRPECSGLVLGARRMKPPRRIGDDAGARHETPMPTAGDAGAFARASEGLPSAPARTRWVFRLFRAEVEIKPCRRSR
jgi:hypothetical protein